MNTKFERIDDNGPAFERVVKPINFFCSAPRARSVHLVGEFNDWNPTSHPMERRFDGWWFLQVDLPHGHHQYRFLVDGRKLLDPKAMGVAKDKNNQDVSLVAVG